jgi:adenosylcobinamide-GDP ribazoletransferase
MPPRIYADLTDFLRFYSRLPVPAGRGAGMPDFARAAWAAPVAGAIIGACGAAILLLARYAGLSPAPAAVCAIASLVIVTGALHEDGLADVADGFGGGATRERKLDIMRDSRLGAYGACALFLALLLRAAALAAMTEQGGVLAALALISAGAVSRVAGLAPMLTLAPARADGAGASAARPTGKALRAAIVIAALFSLAPALAGLPLRRIALADLAAPLAAAYVAGLARRRIGGYTGDVLGAAQQAAEVGVLLVLSAR